MLAVVAVVWWAMKPQTITLSDGRTFRLAGVTWGTNHVQPSLFAHVVNALPKRLADYAHAKFPTSFIGPFWSAKPSAGVWFERVGFKGTPTGTGQWIGLSAFLANDRGEIAGQPADWRASAPGNSVDWVFFKFTEWPRRGATMYCQLQDVNFALSKKSTNWLGANKLGRVEIANRQTGHFPQWQAEPLPVTKSDGDLQVRMEKFIACPEIHSEPPSRKTVFSLAFASPRTNETWAVEEAELSDATGNQIAWLEYYLGEPEPGSSGRIPEALWPDESALRLNLSLKRTAGFPAGDLITFSNLPITPPGGGIFPTTGTSLTNLSYGFAIVARNYRIRDPSWSGPPPGPYWVEIEALKNRDGWSVDIVDVSTDTGEKPPIPGSGRYWRNYRTMPLGTKSLNVTVAVQKMRHVEFVAKPTEE